LILSNSSPVATSDADPLMSSVVASAELASAEKQTLWNSLPIFGIVRTTLPVFQVQEAIEVSRLAFVPVGDAAHHIGPGRPKTPMFLAGVQIPQPHGTISLRESA